MKKSFSVYLLIVLAVILLGVSSYHYYQSLQQKDVAKVEQKSSSLREAISLNNLDAVNFLLKSGADIEQRFTVETIVPAQKSDQGFTALGWALFSNRPEIAKFLIEKGANVKASVPIESSMLYWAIAHEMNDVALLLIDKGADIDASMGYNAAQHASILGLTQVVEKLKEKGVTPDGEASEDLD